MVVTKANLVSPKTHISDKPKGLCKKTVLQGFFSTSLILFCLVVARNMDSDSTFPCGKCYSQSQMNSKACNVILVMYGFMPHAREWETRSMTTAQTQTARGTAQNVMP